MSILFFSRRCKVAIPVRHRLLRDALAQASLDPAVRKIAYREAPDVHDPHASLMSVIIERMDGDFLLAVCETRPRRDGMELARLAGVLESNGLRLLERDAADIRREPLFSNTRTVWLHEGDYVSVNDRLRISAALAEDGPQSVIELEERARPARDIIDTLCALACEDVVDLNVHETPLGPRTMVRGR